MTTGEIANWIEGVLDGTYASDLHSQKVRADENLVYTYGVMQSAQSMGTEGQSLYAQSSYAYEMALRAKKSVQDAINAYSKLANDIQTYSYGEISPAQLAGLGIAPAVITLAAIGAVAVSVTAFAYSYSKAKSDSQAAVDAIRTTTDLVNSLKAAGVSSSDIASIVADLPSPPSGGFGILESVGGLTVLAAIGIGVYLYTQRGRS